MTDAPLVLIVEDDPTVQGLLETLMQMEGYRTMTAIDGLEGLVKAELRHPDLILLDVMMPNVDGERVLRELQGNRELAGVPVLVVTGRADAHEAFDDLVGPDNVIPKPFDADALAERVGALLARGRRG